MCGIFSISASRELRRLTAADAGGGSPSSFSPAGARTAMRMWPTSNVVSSQTNILCCSRRSLPAPSKDLTGPPKMPSGLNQRESEAQCVSREG